MLFALVLVALVAGSQASEVSYEGLVLFLKLKNIYKNFQKIYILY